MKHTIILAVAILSVPNGASATEIALREQALATGSIVRLGDVATTAKGGPIAERLAATPLMPAPAVGSPQHLRNTEVRDLLAARGVDVRGLQFSGAEVVEVSTTARDTVQQSQPQQMADVAAPAEELAAAIVSYLRQATGHDLWNVQVDADEEVLAAFQAAGSQLVVSGGKAPWSGRQRFLISGGPAAASVVAYARVERLEMAAFAARHMERGELIRRSDVELRPHTGALPKQALVSLESLVGREAVQGIRAGSLIMANQVRLPLLVRRGDRVSIRVRAAGVSVRTYATAQQDGSMGELVMVQSPETKDRYSAVVSGLRELEVMAAGASAVDVAAASPQEIR